MGIHPGYLCPTILQDLINLSFTLERCLIYIFWLVRHLPPLLPLRTAPSVVHLQVSYLLFHPGNLQPLTTTALFLRLRWDLSLLDLSFLQCTTLTYFGSETYSVGLTVI